MKNILDLSNACASRDMLSLSNISIRRMWSQRNAAWYRLAVCCVLLVWCTLPSRPLAVAAAPSVNTRFTDQQV